MSNDRRQASELEEIYASARGWYGNNPDGEDALQGALLAALRDPRPRGAESLTSVVRRATRRRLSARSQWQQRESGRVMPPPPQDNAEEVAVLAQALRASFSRLSPRERSAFLSRQRGYTVQQVAQQLGSTPSVVMMYNARARQQMQRDLEDTSFRRWVRGRRITEVANAIGRADSPIIVPGIVLPDGIPVLPTEPLDASTRLEIEGIGLELIQYLSKNPQRLYALPSRRFEELIADVLHRLGCEVELTPRTRDGGYDVVALANPRVGHFMLLVECKRYAADRKVPVGVVRGLYGAMGVRRAAAGVLATTSFFTKQARAEADLVPFRMALKDFNGVCDWLRDAAKPGPSGLILPEHPIIDA